MPDLQSVVVRVIAGDSPFLDPAIVTPFVAIVETAATTSNTSAQVSDIVTQLWTLTMGIFLSLYVNLTWITFHAAGLCKERVYAYAM